MVSDSFTHPQEYQPSHCNTITELVGAQTVQLFTSRQQWNFALAGDAPEWCVDFTSNANIDFSEGQGPVVVDDTADVPRFSLKSFGSGDQNLISATEDAAVLFVESGSLGDPTFVNLDLTDGLDTVLAWGGDFALGSQQNELVTLQITTTSGAVLTNYDIIEDGFFGFIVQTGGALTNIRFVATENDNGAGGEIFTLDNVCGSSMIDAAPTPAPISNPLPTIPSPTPSGNNNCFLSFIPILGNIICFIFDFIGGIF